LENRGVYKLKKYCRTGQATYDIMAHAHCVLDTQDHKHTLDIRSSYCFSTATMVARKPLIVMLFVHCLSCFLFS